METREVRVLENEGQKIFAVLHIPAGDGPFPCVVVHHGFAGNKVGTRRIYVQQAESFSQAGIATIRFDFRGCGDSEGGFDEITLDTQVSDSLQVLSTLSDDSRIDASRVGYLGASLGGSVALMAAHRGAEIRSLALWAPVAHGMQWHQEVQQGPPGSSSGHFLQSGGKDASLTFCAQFLQLRADELLSELPHLPLLHVHGDKDDVVSPAHADLFSAVSGGASRFVRLPESDHSFAHPGERQQLVQQTTDWFLSTL